MATINVSITNDQAKFIDQLAQKFNFDNRSELIRSLIRMVQFQPKLIDEVISFPFVTPDTNSRSKVLNSFKETKKYSPEFLKDLEKGLNNSRFFNQK
ncbi:MAG: ribbon-helix-helix domain-containing protein [Candidatus Shapirobacteria bacterium]